MQLEEKHTFAAVDAPAELAFDRTGPETPAGRYLRQFWIPVAMGPSDLSLALGHAKPLGSQAPELAAAIARIESACRQHGIIAGIHCADGTAARYFAQRGFRPITCFKDTTLIANAALRELTT